MATECLRAVASKLHHFLFYEAASVGGLFVAWSAVRGGAGISKEKVSFVKDTYTFNFPGKLSEAAAAIFRPRKAIEANFCAGNGEKVHRF